MKHVQIPLSLTLLLGLCVVAPAQQTKSGAETPAARPGWVLIEEDVWFRFADQPSHQMKQAHENFVKKDLKAAAHDLRLVGGYLYAAASNAVGDAKSVLVASADEMDRLAREVESGAIKSVKALENAFARAEHALAQHHHAKAKAAIAKQQHSAGGHHLRSAVNHVENGAKWAGHAMEAVAVGAANGVRLVAGKLVEGTGFVADEVGKGVTWVGSEVEKLGKVIEPHKKTVELSSTTKQRK